MNINGYTDCNPKRYKITLLNDKTGFVKSNHEKRELLVSKDVKLKVTDEGKLSATFPNFRPQNSFSFLGIPFNKTSDTDCSIVISDPAKFNSCIQNNGRYLLSGSDITFNGTKNDDVLILYDVKNSKINMNDGNDLVDVEGTSSIFNYSEFKNNQINTGNGDDAVNVFGKFDEFKNNEFYLGKGNDTFIATINSIDDAKSETDYNDKLRKYVDAVSENKIYATDTEKGLFEENIFELKSHNANMLNGDNLANSISEGFQKIKNKQIPQSQRIFLRDDAIKPSQRKLTREDFEKKCQLLELRYVLGKDTKALEEYFETLQKYVDSEAK